MRPADRVSSSGRQSREVPVNFNLRARIPRSSPGFLPWIGQKSGRAAAADFFRKIRVLTEPVKFEVEDILASDGRAAIVGELATRIKSSGKICTSQFAIILTISGDAITRFQMLEDSFGLSKAVHS